MLSICEIRKTIEEYISELSLSENGGIDFDVEKPLVQLILYMVLRRAEFMSSLRMANDF